MRSAGCIINDIADRKFDKFVSRTKSRPIATGEISVKNALVLFFILLFIALLLVLQLNILTLKLSILALLLACLYPYTKRFLPYPQLFLGLAFSMCIPMVFAAVLNYLPPVCGLLWAVNFLWTIMYDTEYAMADRADDLKIGLKSTAVLLGRYDILGIIILQTAIISLLVLLGLKFFVLLPGVLFLYQLYLIRQRKPENCFNAFLNNQWVGGVIFLGFICH